MTYPATSIANYFIKKASDDGEDITLMKLSKLVYIANGWSLAIYNSPLVSEPVQAWKFGPVIESLYHQFKKYGNRPIDMLAIAEKIPDKDTETKLLLDKVWELNKNHTAYQLSNWTHIKGSPWDQVWVKTDGARDQVISNELIRKYFLQLGR